MEKIGIVTTLKAPLRETIQYVHYHLNIGVDKLLLFFDDPNDPAIRYFRLYPQVSCIPCNEEHWRKFATSHRLSLEDRLKINANIGLKTVREGGYDWIIHIDSDELLYSEETIGAVLAKTNSDILRFELYEAVPEKETYDDIFGEVTLFKRTASRFKRILARSLGCRHAFFRGEYFRGHIASKTAVRVKSDITRLGIHQPESGKKTMVMENTERIKLLHFDCCSLETWKTKWTRRLDGTAIVTHMRKNRRRQYEAFARAFQKGDEERLLALYRRLYFIPEKEKRILNRLNLLTYIPIDKQLFDTPRGLGS
jgi:hypothetical protein